MEIVIKICSVIGTIISVLTFYKTIIFILGLFKRKKYPKTDNLHKYAIIIPARNEEKVITNLLDSIYNQDYPLDMIHIFVAASNCTDNTVGLVNDYKKMHEYNNLDVYEHNNNNERTKGYNIRSCINNIKNDYGIEAFDGYFIFDADNVLHNDYITRMNEAFDAGNKIVTSLRNTKNISHNWISFSYAIHWLSTSFKENRAKYLFKMACRIQGTGFLFANELIKDGWNYTSLTEDRSFCTDAVINGYKIAYCDDAVFYDEQPTNLKIAFRQRIRWAKGHLQSTVENEPKLVKNMFTFKNFWASYDMFWLNFPYDIESAVRKIITLSMEIAIAIIAADYYGATVGVLIGLGLDLLGKWNSVYLPVVTLIIYRKRLPKLPVWKTIFHIIMFPFFYLIGTLCSYIALFKHVEWKEIPHNTVMDINELNK